MTDRPALIRRILMAFTMLGIAIASYLTWTHYTSSKIICIGGSGGCDIVQQSRYAVVAGVPVALIGLLGYLAILGILGLEETKGPLADHGPVIIFALSLIGTLYSAYLTYLELFVIFAICQYCIASAAIMAIILAISVYRLSGKLVMERS